MEKLKHKELSNLHKVQVLIAINNCWAKIWTLSQIDSIYCAILTLTLILSIMMVAILVNLFVLLE